MAIPSKPPSRKTPARASGRGLAQELSDVLRVVREHAAAFPQGVDRTRILLSLESGARLELEFTGHAGTEPATEEEGHVCLFHDLEALAFQAFSSIDDLDLAASAKAAAQSLLEQFPNDVKFTSGRRSIERQAAAMAPTGSNRPTRHPPSALPCRGGWMPILPRPPPRRLQRASRA